MKERITHNGINYTLPGDYYLPDLKLPEQDNRPIGIWGERHKRYIKQYHKIRYYNLLTSCKLVDYLTDINEQTEEMYERLIKTLAEQEGITEQLKVENQLLWVRKTNNIIRACQHKIASKIIAIEMTAE